MQKPAASGGIWDRTKAVQDLQSAIKGGELALVGSNLPKAWSLLSVAELGVPFASHFSKPLFDSSLGTPAENLVLKIAMLSEWKLAAAETAKTDEQLAFPAALALGDMPLPAAVSDREKTVSAGFADTDLPISLSQLIEENRSGEAILIAINLFLTGVDGDKDSLIQKAQQKGIF